MKISPTKPLADDGVPAMLAAWAAIVDLSEVLSIVEEHGDDRTRQVVDVWKGTSRLAEVWPGGQVERLNGRDS